MKTIGKGSVSSFLTIVLNVGWYGVVVAMILATCLVVFSLYGNISGWKMDIPVSFGLDTRIVQATPRSLGVASAQLHNVRGNGKLSFMPPSRVVLISTAGSLTFLLALVSWVLGQLRAVFRTLSDGTPFVAANATRIRRVAYVVILGELARAGLVFVGNYYAVTHFFANGLQFDIWPDINFFVLVTGAIILVIAEVFRVGTSLDEDQSLTV